MLGDQLPQHAIPGLVEMIPVARAVDRPYACFPPERRASIRYEDFLADPARVLDVVGRVLGADLTELGKRVAAGEPLTSGHKVAGNRLRMQGSIRLRPDTEWRGRLAPRDRATVRAVAGPLMWRYGYRS